MFESLGEKLNNAFKKFRNKGKLTVADVKAGMREIKLALLEADVNFKVVREFIKIVSERAVGTEVLESLLPAQQVVKIVNEDINPLLSDIDTEPLLVFGENDDATPVAKGKMMEELIRCFLRSVPETKCRQRQHLRRRNRRSS